MGENIPYNEIDVMDGEQSAQFIYLEVLNRTKTTALNTERICQTTLHESLHNHKLGDQKKPLFETAVLTAKELNINAAVFTDMVAGAVLKQSRTFGPEK